MDKFLFVFGLIVVVIIIATGGFGVFQNSGFNIGLPSSGPKASGPGGPVNFNAPSISLSPSSRGSGLQSSGVGQGNVTNRPSPESNIKISSAQRTSANPPDNEYIVLQNSAPSGSAPIYISGWDLSNLQGNHMTIPFASKIPLIANEEGIWLGPGEQAYIISGRSPIGVAFQENLCTGYFNQNNRFSPSVSESCPKIDTRTLITRFNDACLRAIDSLSSCRIPDLSKINVGDIGGECQNYIVNNFTYSTCVAAHRTDGGFYRPTWHVYLNRGARLWREDHDTITLRDSTGKVVTTYEY